MHFIIFIGTFPGTYSRQSVAYPGCESKHEKGVSRGERERYMEYSVLTFNADIQAGRVVANSGPLMYRFPYLGTEY